MTVIDTHQHIWDHSRFDYNWIKPGTRLSQNYLPEDALSVMQAAAVDRCVLIEAGTNQTAETGWFLEQAAAVDHIMGVVGYIDLRGDVPGALAAFSPDQRRWLKGVRIGLHDPAADTTSLHAGLQALEASHLTCDLLILNQTLPQAEALIAAHPGLTFVLDHFAGARISPGGHRNWRAQLAPVALLPNAVIKLSGYLTAADPTPPEIATLQPYFDTALDLFGSHRLMYGSDWPVCLLGDTYLAGIQLLRHLTGALTSEEQTDIWSRTAIQTYQL